MAMQERHTQKLNPKGPSFSSSLLDAIYRSIDDSHKPQDFPIHRRNHNTAQSKDNDIESLRRAIMIEKWIETYTTAPVPAPRHVPSNSASSTDSSLFSESDSSKTSPKSSLKRELGGRFAKTKTRAQKIYGDLKKAKEPISPGGKISNFFNSIFSPRNFKTSQCSVVVDDEDEWSSTIRKSRSMKDTTTCTSLNSRSCLSKNASMSRGSTKSKRSVRFCPVIVDDHDHRHRYNNNNINKVIYNDEFVIKKDIDSKNMMRKYEEVRDYYYRSEQDLDALSCASSDLFELENIGRVDIGEELPVYETTSLEINHTIANANVGGLVM